MWSDVCWLARDFYEECYVGINLFLTYAVIAAIIAVVAVILKQPDEKVLAMMLFGPLAILFVLIVGLIAIALMASPFMWVYFAHKRAKEESK